MKTVVSLRGSEYYDTARPTILVKLELSHAAEFTEKGELHRLMASKVYHIASLVELLSGKNNWAVVPDINNGTVHLELVIADDKEIQFGLEVLHKVSEIAYRTL